MITGTVRPQNLLQRSIRVPSRDRGKSRVICLLRSPVQKRQVHQTVHDHPAGLIIIPCTDIIPKHIKPPRQQVRSMLSSDIRLTVTRKTVVRHRRMHPHKSHIMIQILILFQRAVQPLLHPLSAPAILRSVRGMIHLPEQPAPEAVRPPGNILLTPVFRISAVHRDIGNPVLQTPTFTHHFPIQLLEYFLKPFFVFFL